ncbi:putative rRNA methyltransferase YlbH [Neochlamydia sp. AcF65]|uniref:16S rRNA (guanine(966)-N(2))-methyltransferase RsmD n=1 Tax=Neochlamydia sp. AcF65 TaxID=2795735 RepID=UPI001BC9D0FA|nr:16S rRNA (guanine(966)-N(2))-methyltransferase RsmD [Neochlamydia sp. AcF65]MBS4165219.1 putative rRNA methyltransferase YlbH [Neochlamydia sp. AcF65]
MLYIIAGRYKNRKIQSPKHTLTRPTTNKLRGALFNICQTYIEDASFLDLFCGSGAMGLEAISRGAAQATFVDEAKASLQCVRENIQSLGVEKQAHPLWGEASTVLKKLAKQGDQFDIIYIDPPYETKGLSEEILRIIDESTLLKVEGRLFIEESKAMVIDKEKWLTLQLESARKMGRTQLVQFKKISYPQPPCSHQHELLDKY